MAKANLSAANYVTFGYGQVEPNHLSAQRNGKIYAQLPAVSTIDKLENGQFVKYDYANGVVNFTGEGDWMLVYNEVKVYRPGEGDQDFAMIKANYNGKIYSAGGTLVDADAHSRNYSNITTPADPYEVDSTETPFGINTYRETEMPTDSTMVPRVLKTDIGDIFTTNMITVLDISAGIEKGKYLAVDSSTGILTEQANKPASGMVWQVVKVYTLADRQKAVKIIRVA